MRRSSSGCCIRSSTRARASWRRASRCVPVTSTSCTSTATAFPPTGADRCTGPQQAGLARVVETMRASRPRTARAGGRRRCWSNSRPPAGWDSLGARGQGAESMRRATASLAMLGARGAEPGLPARRRRGRTHEAAHRRRRSRSGRRARRLFQGLGDFHRPSRPLRPLAQQYFDQGMRLLGRSITTSRRAPSRRPRSWIRPAPPATGAWRSPSDRTTTCPRWRSRARASRGRRCTKRRRNAAARRGGRAGADRRARGALSGSAQPLGPADPHAVLKRLRGGHAARWHAAFPDDLDVQTLCAEARDERACLEAVDGGWAARAPARSRSRRGSSRCLRRDPDHPGANHYYIHVMEASPHPQKALAVRGAAARHDAGGRAHGAHARAHHAACRALRGGRRSQPPRRGRRSGLSAAQTAPPDHYAMYLAHNYSFLAYSAAMEGRKAETLAAVQALAADRPASMRARDGRLGLAPGAAVCGAGALWAVGRADCARAARCPGAGPDAPATSTAAASALAARGRVADADAALAELRALARSCPRTGAGFNACRILASPSRSSRRASPPPSFADDGGRHAARAGGRGRGRAAPTTSPPTGSFRRATCSGAQLLIAGQPARRRSASTARTCRRNPRQRLGAVRAGGGAARRRASRAEAARGRAQFSAAWRHADVRLPGSAFWFAGA